MNARRDRSTGWFVRAAVSLAALKALASCGGHQVIEISATPDGGSSSAGATDAAFTTSPIGTAVVKNGGDPTGFAYSHAILAKLPGYVALMLFLTDRPRTCGEHLAGVDYVGERDIYFPVTWPNGDGPAGGTWHFTSGSDGAPPPPGTPQVNAWFLEHRKCGQAGTPWGTTSFVNEKNYLTLSEVSTSRVSGTFIAQMGFNVAGWDGPDVMYLDGSFDTVPCVVTSLYPPDPGVQTATLPSITCP